jgi:hypothetical protein
MALFIANTTKQNFHHHFRVPEMNRPYFVRIQSGTQVQVERRFSPATEAMIIEQLQKYGARNAKEVSGRLEDFPGIFWRQDRPITEGEIVAGHDAVVDAQSRRAAAESSKSALGFDAAHRDKKTRRRGVLTTEVEVVQEVPKGEKPSGNEVTLHVTVANDGSDNVKLPGL